MGARLVLGCGTVGQTLVESIAERPGDLLVVDDSESRVEALREENISATFGDPTDGETVREAVADHEAVADREAVAGRDVTESVVSVVVAGEDPERNVQSAHLAVQLFSSAHLLAYLGQDCDADQRNALAGLADRIVDPTEAVVGEVLSVSVGERATLTANLRRSLRAIDGTLGVFMHDNPDPDAIASAIALCRLAESVGVEAEPCYFGDISHQENRAFVNLLEFDLRNVESGDDLSAFGGIALVDHSRPGVNDQLPTDTPVDVVIDHHPPKEPVEAGFVDLRSDVGATSTLLAEHLERLGVDLSEDVATGLLYGIRVDTKDFSREVSTADFDAAAALVPHADVDTLNRVESPSVGPETFETLARAIRNRRVAGTVLATCVGRLSDRDALAQAADQLLNMEDVTTTLVYGFREGTIFLSARARGTDIDLGETMRSAFGRIGSAGGHADMAGAQIPLNPLGDVDEDDDDALAEIVGEIITDRFFETIHSLPGTDFQYVSEGNVDFDATLPDGGE